MRVESGQNATTVKNSPRREDPTKPENKVKQKQERVRPSDAEIRAKLRQRAEGSDKTPDEAAQQAKSMATENKLKKVLASGSFAFSPKEREVLTEILNKKA